jgi:hypothetical protein
VLGMFSEMYAYPSVLHYISSVVGVLHIHKLLQKKQFNHENVKEFHYNAYSYATQNYSHHTWPKVNDASRKKNTENMAYIKIQFEGKFVFRKTMNIPYCIIAVASPME